MTFPSACPVGRPPLARQAEFEDGFARLASSVAVVSCWGAEGPAGLAVQSLTRISLAPPRLLFCVDKAQAEHADLLRAESVALSLLADDQQDEASLFASPARRTERFAPSRWSLDPSAPPIARDPAAAFTGPVRARIDAGPVTIFVIDVVTVRSRPAAPLIHFAGDLVGLEASSARPLAIELRL